MDAGFGLVLIRSILAGWLIALVVWLLPGAESGRVSIIIILTWLIGVGGFNHIIAGSNKMFFLVASGAETWGWYFTRFFGPTLLGNIIGGVSLARAGCLRRPGVTDNQTLTNQPPAFVPRILF